MTFEMIAGEILWSLVIGHQATLHVSHHLHNKHSTNHLATGEFLEKEERLS